MSTSRATSRATSQASGVREEATRKWVRYPRFTICVSAADRTISTAVIRRAYEPHITALLKRTLRPGQSFLDLGANIGFHTLTAASLVGPAGRCVGVEMCPQNCALIRASVEANRFDQVRVVNCAVSDARETLTFTRTPGTTNGMIVSEAMRPQLNGEWLGAPELVEAKPVDDILEDGHHVDLVKMDIEGWELKALGGMSGLIRRCRPAFVFEFFPGLLSSVGGVEGTELLEAFHAHGYRLHVVSKRGRPSRTPLGAAEAVAETQRPDRRAPLIDLLALPG